VTATITVGSIEADSRRRARGIAADDGIPVRAGEASKRIDEDTGAEIFRHSEAYIKRLLAEKKFVVLKTAEFVASVHPETGRKVHFRAVVARKKSATLQDGPREG